MIESLSFSYHGCLFVARLNQVVLLCYFKTAINMFVKGHRQDSKLAKMFSNVSYVLQRYKHTKVGLYKGLLL